MLFLFPQLITVPPTGSVHLWRVMISGVWKRVTTSRCDPPLQIGGLKLNTVMIPRYCTPLTVTLMLFAWISCISWTGKCYQISLHQEEMLENLCQTDFHEATKAKVITAWSAREIDDIFSFFQVMFVLLWCGDVKEKRTIALLVTLIFKHMAEWKSPICN